MPATTFKIQDGIVSTPMHDEFSIVWRVPSTVIIGPKACPCKSSGRLTRVSACKMIRMSFSPLCLECDGWLSRVLAEYVGWCSQELRARRICERRVAVISNACRSLEDSNSSDRLRGSPKALLRIGEFGCIYSEQLMAQRTMFDLPIQYPRSRTTPIARRSCKLTEM